MSNTCHRSDGLAEDIKGVSKGIVDGDLIEAAAEQMIPKNI